jgi:hypothetical protein
LGEPLAGRLFPLPHITLSANQSFDLVDREVVLAPLPELDRAQASLAHELEHGVPMDAEHDGDLVRVEQSPLYLCACSQLSLLEANARRFQASGLVPVEGYGF